MPYRGMLQHQGRPVRGQGPVYIRLLQAGQTGRAVSHEVRRQPWGPWIFARENSGISTRCLDLEERRKENSLSFRFRFLTPLLLICSERDCEQFLHTSFQRNWECHFSVSCLSDISLGMLWLLASWSIVKQYFGSFKNDGLVLNYLVSQIVEI